MKHTIALVTAILALAMPAAPAQEPFDPDAAKLRISKLTTEAGEVLIYTKACRLRDEEWLDDLEDEALRQATMPDAKFGTALLAKESKLAEADLEQAKMLATFRLTQQGSSTICGDIKASAELKRADAMVVESRKPKNWDAIVPVVPPSSQKP